MNPDDIEHDAPDPDSYDSEPPRSIFSALWFRAVLVVVVVGVIAALAVPYVLEWVSPPPPTATAAKLESMPSSPAAPTTTAPASETAMSEKPSSPSTTPLAPALKEDAPKAAPPAEKPVKPAVEKPAPAAKAVKPAPARRTARAVAKAPAAPVRRPYFVQVGAFKDRAHAGRVAARLREAKFKVEESTTTAPGPAAEPAPSAAAAAADRYDVFVSGAPAADINAKLAGKGLATEAAATGVVVKPPLPLRDAVALSKDLAVQGFKVQVRRAGGPAPAPPPPAAAEASATFHRVRVGPFSDRAAAAAALDVLREKGYKDSFIARGGA